MVEPAEPEQLRVNIEIMARVFTFSDQFRAIRSRQWGVEHLVARLTSDWSVLGSNLIEG